MEPGRGDLLARKPPTSHWAIWSILLFFHKSSSAHKLQKEVLRATTPDAVTLGEFLLPKLYLLGAPSPLEIGVSNFSWRPNEWAKAAIAPPP